MPGRTSCSQLITALSSWFECYNANKPSVNIVYADIVKAFDSVSHRKLVSVMAWYGIQCNVLPWIKSFMADRFQAVCIGGTLSKFLPVHSEVPQGSILGPILFVYINNLFRVIESHSSSKLLLYADDAKVFSTDPANLHGAIMT